MKTALLILGAGAVAAVAFLAGRSHPASPPAPPKPIVDPYKPQRAIIDPYKLPPPQPVVVVEPEDPAVRAIREEGEATRHAIQEEGRRQDRRQQDKELFRQ